MNIWIVSLYDPTPIDKGRPFRYTSIALAANKLGYNVIHFSCTFRHHKRENRFDKTTELKISDKYEMVYIYQPPYRKNVSVKRMISNGIYTNNLKKYIKNRSKPDLILTAYPPISLSFFLSRWAKRNSIPFILDIIDPMPDALLRLSPRMFRNLFKNFLFPMYYQFKQILKNSTAVIGISDEYVNWARSFNLFNGKSKVYWPAVPYKSIQEKLEQLSPGLQKDKNKLRLIYAGNLGINYDIPSILKAAEIIEKKHPDSTEFIIAGTGYYQGMIEEYMLKSNNIRFLGFLNHDDLIKQYLLADLGLAQYPPGATQSVTYKLFDYLSAGLPILNSLMSEMALIIDNYVVGMNNPPEDVDKLVGNIEKFLFDKVFLDKCRKNSLALASSKGDSEKVYEELVEFLVSIS